jgi:hypothetical protein
MPPSGPVHHVEPAARASKTTCVAAAANSSAVRGSLPRREAVAHAEGAFVKLVASLLATVVRVAAMNGDGS